MNKETEEIWKELIDYHFLKLQQMHKGRGYPFWIYCLLSGSLNCKLIWKYLEMNPGFFKFDYLSHYIVFISTAGICGKVLFYLVV